MVYAPELNPAWDKAKTPNEYFQNLFPSQTAQYGPAFYEAKESTVEGFRRITPVSLNIDLHASILSDERLGLSVIYYEPEMQFYYLEPIQKIYMPTSPEKLQNLYRGMLIRCAQEMNRETNTFSLFQFRDDKWAKAVTSRAKSILAADQSFFSTESKNNRKKGSELFERVARVFVDEMLSAEPGQILKLQEAYSFFRQLLKQRNLPDLTKADFKAYVGPLIREQFHVALRNDWGPDGGGARGWKGVKLIRTVPG